MDALVRTFNQHKVLNGLTAHIKRGDVVALLGKNGAGKSTLLHTILGFGVPDGGEVKLWQTPSIALTQQQKQHIGFVPQQDELLEQLTGAEQLKLFSKFRTHWDQACCDRLVDSWKIPLNTRISKMSLGERQKLSIVLALCHQPELLILDEPVASLDPMARRQFLAELIDIAAEQQRAIIFSSHIVSDMERIANQVWLLKNGELAFQGPLDDLKESVVRLHFPQTLTEVPTELTLVRRQQLGNSTTLTVQDWQPGQLASLQASYPAIQVEYLSLEEIFLELNR
ncbi:ABC transporter ATP-binding protein [Rheinheimera riviphila]|uniref:ABC transporter ATP-binding protein n=2 Tax=Rheinheimera riviphila TaxID=1834037 RepID=A0A437R099_9GAMM|nr:ABC transporter ATP-binding protein [Rheinheimera riviphila]